MHEVLWSPSVVELCLEHILDIELLEITLGTLCISCQKYNVLDIFGQNDPNVDSNLNSL